MTASAGPATGAITLDLWLAEARGRLAAVSDTPETDARWLAEDRLALTTTQLILAGRRALTPGEQDTLDTALKRRLAGEPLALITGHVGFATLDLAVSADVLIPRPDTETLVEAVLEQLPAERACRIADLGTGSGAIALALAAARPNWQLVATDISTAALAVARDNAARLELDNVVFRPGDWLDALNDDVFDALVSNPPYIAADDPHLAALTHEPRGALVADEQGLADLRRLCRGASRHLLPGAPLLLEHGDRQGAAVRRLMTDNGLARVITHRDLGDRDRVTQGWRPTPDTPA